MNLANKKFKKLVQETYQSVMLDVVIGFHDFCKGKISQELVNAALDNLVLFSLTYPEEEVKLYNKLNKEYLEKNKDKSKFYSTLQTIIEHYDKQLPYLYFNELISTFDYFKIPDNERADILSYFLNKNIINVTSFDFDNNAYMIQRFLDESQISKYRSDITVDSILSKKDASIAMCKDLRNIINNKGDIVPNKSAIDYKDKLKAVFFDTDEHHLDLIISESEKRAKEIEEKKTTQKTGAAEHTSKAKLTEETLTAIYEEQIKNCKIQRQAVQKLRNYLRDDMPIRYLKSEDLIEINKALEALNYSDEQIMKIQKNIVVFNHDYEEQQKRHKLKAMLNNIFNEEGIKVFYQSEDIVLDSEPIKNPFYYTIIECYNKIKDGLIKAFDMNRDANKNNEEYEMLIIEIMCEMDTLIEATWNYKFSDFRQTRKRKEEN